MWLLSLMTMLVPTGPAVEENIKREMKSNHVGNWLLVCPQRTHTIESMKTTAKVSMTRGLFPGVLGALPLSGICHSSTPCVFCQHGQRISAKGLRCSCSKWRIDLRFEGGNTNECLWCLLCSHWKEKSHPKLQSWYCLLVALTLYFPLHPHVLR